MLSIRTLGRAVPRTIARPSAIIQNRTFAALRKPTQVHHGWRALSIPQKARFSTTFKAFQDTKEGTTDEELSAKFAEELQLETESSDVDEMPAHLKEFIDSNVFELQHAPGEQDVTLTRAFGNEKITVSFSIAALNEVDHDPDAYSQDRAMYDDEAAALDAQSGGAQSKNTTNQGRTEDGNFNVAPENGASPAAREEIADDEVAAVAAEPSFPVPMSITVEKDGVAGALNFDAVAHDGSISIENVYYFAKKEFAEAQTAEHDWSRRALYTGPPYGNLDEDLQVLLERYLYERGIDTALAVWIPEFIDFKEQCEYVKWLNDAKAFIDA